MALVLPFRSIREYGKLRRSRTCFCALNHSIFHSVRNVVNQIIRYGRVIRPSLGIHCTDDRIVGQLSRQLRRAVEGVLVAEVVPNSPAAAAGLQPSEMRGDGSVRLGDLIVAVNTEKIQSVEDLLTALEQHSAGDTVRLTIQRGCDPRRTQQVSVRLEAREQQRGSVAQQRRMTGQQRNRFFP